MSSYRSTAIRVLRLRVKDKYAPWLSGLAREVNTVFNYCNELSGKVFERERRSLSGYDFWPFLKGATRGECALHLPVQAVQEIAEEYARRRRQHRKIRLAWRKSGGARRSLGWIPFKVRTIRYRAGDEAFSTQTCSVCDSRTGPQGREGLGIRGWQCGVCGAIHDRDVNAAQNILAAGHRRLAEEILVLQGRGGCQTAMGALIAAWH
jgi:transposase